MKTIFYTITLLIAFSAGAQTLNETQKLAATARIWGFLKYYHPQVAAGKYNWDYKLAEVLPKVTQAKTKEELSAVYLNWIEEQGDVPVCKKCAKVNNESFDKNFDMSWMQDDNIFTKELSAKLKYIENNRLLGEKYYVSPKGNRGSLGITNEVSYNNFEYPQEEGRLLTLFRFWNVVEYFSPNKYLTDVKWDDVLTQSIPKVINAKDATQYQLALTEISANTNDSHGQLSSNADILIYGRLRVPFLTLWVEDKLIVTRLINKSLCQKDNIQIGDVITHLDGKLLADKFRENSPYYFASNEASKKSYAGYLLWGNSTTAKITFERAGKTAEKEINRYSREDFKPDIIENDNGYKLLEGTIGYADLSILEAKNINSMIATFSKCQAIILDLRKYPKWIVHELCAKLTPDDTDFVKYLIADLDYPGRFVWKKLPPVKSGGKNTYNGKIIVLANEGTLSRGEFTAMALQAVANTTIVGSQTAGADGESIEVTLPGDYRTTFTGNGVFYPDGRETQRIGIVPDVEIRPTIAGIKAGKDEVLDKAIEIAKK